MIIQSVRTGSFADLQGLEPGLVIVRINKKSTGTKDQFDAVVKEPENRRRRGLRSHGSASSREWNQLHRRNTVSDTSAGEPKLPGVRQTKDLKSEGLKFEGTLNFSRLNVSPSDFRVWARLNWQAALRPPSQTDRELPTESTLRGIRL